MKKTNKKINLIANPETLVAVHTHTCIFIGKIHAIVAFINNVKKDEKF